MEQMAISEQVEQIIVTESCQIRNNLKRCKLTNCRPQNCIREVLTKECVRPTTTPVYLICMRNNVCVWVCVCVLHAVFWGMQICFIE